MKIFVASCASMELEFRLQPASVEVAGRVGSQWYVNEGQPAMRQKSNHGGQPEQAKA
jgi:hypothetical protein